MSTVTVIVLDVPGLANQLEINGYKAIDGENAIATANELRESGAKYVVIADAVSPVSRAWLSRQASQRTPVLITGGDEIEGTRVVTLPATFNEIMANFGAPASPKGDVIIGLVEEEVQSEEDMFSVFGGFESADEVPVVAPEPSMAKEPERAASSVFDIETPATSVLDEQVFEAPTAEQANGARPHRDEEPQSVSVFGPATEAPSRSVLDEVDVLPTRIQPTDSRRLSPPEPRPAPEEAPIRVRTPPARALARKSNVIVVFGAKGGIGKSSTVIALAERAATSVVRPSDKPFKVIAIDANRGQGDMRTYLHLRNVPSIYDAAKSGRATASILTPTKLTSVRVGKPELHFGVVLAPTQDQADPSVVTSSVYAEVIDEARSLADLVIIDTQIKEHFDTTGIFDDVIVPLLRSGAWGLGITNSTTASYDNLKRALTKLQTDQVPRDRIMFSINNADPEGGIDPVQVENNLSHLANWVGMAVAEPAVAAASNVGEVPGVDGDAPEFTTLLDAVIGRVLGGAEVLKPTVSRSAQEVGAKEKRRRWGRR
jgi:Mrp family chromosome partitioning ATPase